MSEIDVKTALNVHLGIVRTGSSSIRRLIRDYCEISGEVCSHFPETDQEQKSDDAKYILMECPYPYHKQVERPCRYFTTLRDPVDSVISEYYFYLERNEIDKDVTLDDYISALPASYNKQARWMAAINSPDETRHLTTQPRNMFECGFYDTIDDSDLLEEVKESAAKYFAVIGLLERLEETAFLFATQMGWSTVPILKRMNPSIRTSIVKKTPPTVLQVQKIKACNRADEILYHSVVQNFNQQVQGIMQTYGSQFATYQEQCQVVDRAFLEKQEELVEKHKA
ncbi:sulfotransferase family 2 domain-containing protein [Terasakiella sp. A23]|uniref:sulfotransferase family 2 domain-containing protein n=1 Tax=Terasakiella sp. FCG-A23 TaxID=3080561 RepID=UPI0029557EE4|nr:sulfotransferase family 2 domain-containing protein [Terasakiella sp. A23]MDV7339015.1 sulfotransferase family 2 domain-containing protein [Terasakiella sp. A23]